ncbi:MAG: hypothetical protein AAB867_01580, partial [Patescibacteria group bacterium]
MKRPYAILGVVLMLVALAAGLGFWLNQNITITTPTSGEPAGETIALPDPIMQFFAGGSLKRPTFVLRWSNLPANTAQIKIFRAKADGKQQLWKVVAVNGQISGAVEIVLRPGENALAYSYSVSVVNQTGDTTWTSSSTAPSTSTPPDIVISTSTVVSDPPPPSTESGTPT